MIYCSICNIRHALLVLAHGIADGSNLRIALEVDFIWYENQVGTFPEEKPFMDVQTQSALL